MDMHRFWIGAAGCLAAGCVGLADAATFVDHVVSYTPGSGVGSYTNPDAALGRPAAGTGFGNLLNPFNPHWQPDQIARIGDGGELTLRFSNLVLVGDGADIGVFANTFFVNGTNNAGIAGVDAVRVHVSADGVNWVPVSDERISFDMPSTYYLEAGLMNSSAMESGVPTSPAVADYGKPFEGTASDFIGKDGQGVVDTLDGSAGGTWLDLSGTGLSAVGYIRFTDPLGGGNTDTFIDNTFELDAVSIANSKVGAAVPEPASAVLLSALGLVLARRRRGNTA